MCCYGDIFLKYKNLYFHVKRKEIKNKNEDNLVININFSHEYIINVR
jgi:hypothetical protein